MDNKKGKSIAMKLLDDLLDDDESSTKAGSSKQDKIPSPPASEGAAKAAPKAVAQKKPQVEDTLDLDLSTEEHSLSNKTAKGGDDRTLKLSESKIIGPNDQQRSAGTNAVKTPEARPTVGRPTPLRPGGASSATDISLATSENLRIAQQRILELEQEIERLRSENEQLAAAGETLRRRSDELLTQANQLQGKLRQTSDSNEQEIEILRQSMTQKEKDLAAAKMKVEELEMRLSTNLHKIRVRERELENRLELVKMESAALVRSKDEIILDLKRQVDQLTIELENYRSKGQELNKQIGDKQEMLRRTVKALRIALSMLEGEDDTSQVLGQQKKVK